ncbi:DUF6173 family protein [Burkholderia sp. BDU5]|uniref:DUF6173 family protein n=1 Tax=Burkholderia sp. BDU5 TaxID=1385590 RepID=UPI0007525441|nr:DUF6173 family protein [Burkholderia sp. BDU5]KVE40302.1 hypothetical protein WS69_29250 [Burkholderia sp. BDU5]
MSRSSLNTDPDSIPSYEPSPFIVTTSPSELAFKTLIKEIKAFEATLTAGEAVGAMLASFGKEVTIQITEIAVTGQFIRFDGVTEDGSAARLVQHFTQASVLLTKLTSPVVPPNPIGFVPN